MSNRVARLERELTIAIRLAGGTDCKDKAELFDDDNAWMDYQTRRYQEKAAKEICADCPVQMLCREYAVMANEPTGIWGGMTTVERQSLVTKPL